jgi:hypothetical protein
MYKVRESTNSECLLLHCSIVVLAYCGTYRHFLLCVRHTVASLRVHQPRFDSSQGWTPPLYWDPVRLLKWIPSLLSLKSNASAGTDIYICLLSRLRIHGGRPQRFPHIYITSCLDVGETVDFYNISRQMALEGDAVLWSSCALEPGGGVQFNCPEICLEVPNKTAENNNKHNRM